MWKSISEYLKLKNEEGINFPYAKDGSTKKPSVTLFFAYVSYYMCLFAIGYTFFKNDNLSPAILSLLLFVICTTFYRMRMIDKFKLDLDEKSIELESTNESEK